MDNIKFAAETENPVGTSRDVLTTEPVKRKKAAPKEKKATKPSASARKSKAASDEKVTYKKSTAKRSKIAEAIITTDQRRDMIATLAYLRAERQGFTTDPVQDWLTAEAEVDAMLAENHLTIAAH